MTNSSLTNRSSSTSRHQVQGITEIRQKNIAALIARGFSVKYVAKKLKISEDRIYHLLSDRNSLVNAEINRFLNETFGASDRRLVNLYDKALQKLDAMLSSSDEETQCRAIDRIIKIYLARSAKNAVTIQQYFGIQSQEGGDDNIESIDEVILRRRKERGLDRSPDDGDRPDSFPDDSSPDDSSPNDSFIDNSPQDASPNDSSPDASFPDPSSPEYKAFVDKIMMK
jgi:plasmid maintenance system antidote protein VapI